MKNEVIDFEPVFQRMAERARLKKLLPPVKVKRVIKTHCRRGHALTPENVYSWNKKRQCRLCKARSQKLREGKIKVF